MPCGLIIAATAAEIQKQICETEKMHTHCDVCSSRKLNRNLTLLEQSIWSAKKTKTAFLDFRKRTLFIRNVISFRSDLRFDPNRIAFCPKTRSDLPQNTLWFAPKRNTIRGKTQVRTKRIDTPNESLSALVQEKFLFWTSQKSAVSSHFYRKMRSFLPFLIIFFDIRTYIFWHKNIGT